MDTDPPKDAFGNIIDPAEQVAYRIRCDSCGRESYVINPRVKDMRDHPGLPANRGRKKPGPRWTLMHGGRFARDFLVCSDICFGLVRQEKTPQEMFDLGFAVGDYITLVWPETGVVPPSMLMGWPPAIERKTIFSPRVYVSGPLRGMGESIGPNVHAAVMASVELTRAGYIPFIPHLYALAQCIAPEGEDFWMHLNRAWLSTCGAAIRLPGPSVGSDREEQWAHEMGIPWWPSLESFLNDRPDFIEAKPRPDPELIR